MVYFISNCCSWLLVLAGDLALFMLFPPSFMCNFLLPHHPMPSWISLYPDRFCPNFHLPYALFPLLLACLGWLLFWWWVGIFYILPSLPFIFPYGIDYPYGIVHRYGSHLVQSWYYSSPQSIWIFKSIYLHKLFLNPYGFEHLYILH